MLIDPKDQDNTLMFKDLFILFWTQMIRFALLIRIQV